MTEEDKEAIEQLKSWREFIINNRDKVNKANDIEFYLRTVLNTIQKQQEEIQVKLKQTRKEYTKIETQYNKEYNPIKKEVLKEKLIRLDERIEVYKEILK